MRHRMGLALSLTASLVAAELAPFGGVMAEDVVPPALLAAVEGCWLLAPSYRLVIRREKRGIAARQETCDRRGKRVVRSTPVRYRAEQGVLDFEGIGRQHRVVVVVRYVADTLESSFRAELTPGQWTTGPWERATRCAERAGLPAR